jgi:hypothetical protein
MAQSVKHKRSALLVNGSPKLPTTSQLEVGEIAINFAEGHETLSTRNNNSGIATFSSDAVLDSKYATTGNVNTLSSSTVAHTVNTTIHLPAVTSSDNGKVLKVVNGVWTVSVPINVYSGNNAPDNSMGNNGDIYLQTS